MNGVGRLVTDPEPELKVGLRSSDAVDQSGLGFGKFWGRDPRLGQPRSKRTNHQEAVHFRSHFSARPGLQHKLDQMSCMKFQGENGHNCRDHMMVKCIANCHLTVCIDVVDAVEVDLNSLSFIPLSS
jgi:hypothetical protein